MNVLWLAVITIACAPCIAKRRGLSAKCMEPLEVTGNEICEQSRSLWYFSNSTKKCVELKNACSENEHTFPSLKACNEKCGKRAGTEKKSRLCWQQPRQGRCKAAFPRWYWSPTKGCQLHSGCYKNGFSKLSQCKRKCGASTWPSKPRPRQNLRQKRHN
uniref:Putative bilaris n=1 Tax=Rhipicephalus pulchellus TaxID=72859 RepID=L7LSJ2_RHIPC